MPSSYGFEVAMRRGLQKLQRAFRRMPEAAQAAIELGDKGWRQHRPVQQYEAEFRNQHWQADHQDLEIWVKPPGKHTKPVRPWLTIFVDCYSLFPSRPPARSGRPRGAPDRLR